MPQSIIVSDMAGLYDALSKCIGNKTILLEGGNYGGFHLTPKSQFDFTFPSTVTIASKDPDNPAVFSSADVRGAENLALNGDHVRLYLQDKRYKRHATVQLLGL